MLNAHEARRDNLRRKIAFIGGTFAAALSRELDRTESEISRIRNALRASSGPGGNRSRLRRDQPRTSGGF